jgi:uncharacterized repeat protein (TIGR02543 family)
MRKINKTILSLCSLLLFVPLSVSCSSAFIGDETYTIKDITHHVDADGNTVVVITFNEDGKDPITFTIDKGEAGADGNGIASINAEVQSDAVVLTITYTDKTMAPTEISVPIIKGKDGVSVVGVDVSSDTNGNTVLIFRYSDDKTSDPIVIPKGTDGVGIANIAPTTNEDGSITLTISFTDSTRNPVVLTIPKGEPGVSLLSITSDQQNGYYYLHLVFSDGSKQDVSFAIPSVASWLAGTSDPEASLGNDGDFYMNTANGGIFHKESGSWVFIIRLWQNATSYYYVTFDPNGGLIDGAASNVREKVKAGEYISDLPTPTLTGKTFAGWWTSIAEDPNSGHFTVLTPVFSDLTLYARWSV